MGDLILEHEEVTGELRDAYREIEDMNARYAEACDMIDSLKHSMNLKDRELEAKDRETAQISLTLKNIEEELTTRDIAVDSSL